MLRCFVIEARPYALTLAARPARRGAGGALPHGCAAVWVVVTCVAGRPVLFVCGGGGSVAARLARENGRFNTRREIDPGFTLPSSA
eukprot:354423-Chlamydomonas_euryale.AAC.4